MMRNSRCSQMMKIAFDFCPEWNPLTSYTTVITVELMNIMADDSQIDSLWERINGR